jgi:hypothetical protein
MVISDAGRNAIHVTNAQKLSLRRVIVFLAASAGAMVAAWLNMRVAEWRGKAADGHTSDPVAIVVAWLIWLSLTACFVWQVFFWKPRCPHCKKSRARFVFPDNVHEHLVCAACGYDEPTGAARDGD